MLGKYTDVFWKKMAVKSNIRKRLDYCSFLRGGQMSYLGGTNLFIPSLCFWGRFVTDGFNFR